MSCELAVALAVVFQENEHKLVVGVTRCGGGFQKVDLFSVQVETDQKDCQWSMERSSTHLWLLAPRRPGCVRRNGSLAHRPSPSRRCSNAVRSSEDLPERFQAIKFRSLIIRGKKAFPNQARKPKRTTTYTDRLGHGVAEGQHPLRVSSHLVDQRQVLELEHVANAGECHEKPTTQSIIAYSYKYLQYTCFIKHETEYNVTLTPPRCRTWRRWPGSWA